MDAILIRVVVFADDGGGWCAHALDCDTVVMAPHAEAAVDALIKILHAQIRHDQRHRRSPLAGFGPAPRSVWEVFSAAASARQPVAVRRHEGGSVLHLLVASLAAHAGAMMFN